MWSAWIRGISPEKNARGWFVRVDASFASLPTSGGGVYQIGTGTDEVVESVTYVGRATKCRADCKGVTLRRRLYTDYSYSGSHLHLKLRSALEEGKHVWFRWQILKTVHECCEAEAALLGEGDYAWNSAPVKSLTQKLDEVVAAAMEKVGCSEKDALEAMVRYVQAKLKT